MNLDSSFNSPSFKGRREDKNQLKTLSDNNMPILPNKKRLILSAIDNLGKTGEKQDIEMLMGTVETMKYGIHNNSEFAKALGGTNGEKENTDWDGIMQSTIKQAISTQKTKDQKALQARYEKIFGEEKPLTEDEKTMLELRDGILASKDMKNILNDTDKTLEATRLTQNLDYFLASSEINNEDKIKCLGLMNHFMSDDYEIHPQLKEHKVQALSEMVNDLIVARPDEEKNTIKQVNQRQTGMCAAISIARKTISYEDKVRATEIMMAELDNKPTMTVFDRTELGSGKTVEITKSHVDFTDAMKKGYRIVDAGAHQWMNAADKIGDGTVENGYYQGFDPENYEIFRDSHWNNDLGEEFKPAQNWLRHLGKEDEAVDKVVKRNAKIVKIQREVGEFKKSYEISAKKSSAAIRDTLVNLDPTLSDSKSAALTNQIIKADKLENTEYKINKREPKETKQAKLAAFLKSEMPNVPEEKIKEQAEKLAALRDEAVDAQESLNKLTEHKKPESVFAYNKNLFSVAAHHRRSVEAELNVPERLASYEKALNIPSRDSLIHDKAEKMISGKNAEQSSIAKEALKIIDVEIPSKLDNVLSELNMGDRKAVAVKMLDAAAAKVQAGDAETVKTYAENAHIKPNANQVLKKLANAKEALISDASNADINKAVNLLGYNNSVEFTAGVYQTFVDAVNNGEVPKEQLNKMFGSDADKQLARLGQEIKSLDVKQSAIEKELNVPSRKDAVLRVLEATGEILPEKTLQAMQAKFDKVADAKAESDNRIVDPGVKKPKVPDSAYKFTEQEKEQFAQIESKIKSMKTYAKTNQKAVNEALEPQLNALYEQTGRLGGRLWVNPEGSSGLFDAQSIRLLEMITGKHYYNEDDIDKVVEHIKKGEGSGTSSTNVSHKDYSGHAQYVADVAPVEVIDPTTKKSEMKDVLFHDNSWGYAEDSATWVDENGVTRTDYGKEYGGPDGYVFDTRMFNGTFVEDQKYQVGVTKDGAKFDLWRSTRIAGENPKADKTLTKVMDNIFKVGSAATEVAKWKAELKGKSVDTEKMDKVENLMSVYSEKLNKQVAGIKTEADVENIKNEALSFALKKTALMMSVDSPEIRNKILSVVNPESVDLLASKLPDIQKELIQAPLAKSSNMPNKVGLLTQHDVIQAFEDAYQDKDDKDIPSNLQEIFLGLYQVNSPKLDGSLSGLKNSMIKNANKVISENIKDKKVSKKLKTSISEIFEKAIDEKIKINSLDDLKQYGQAGELLVKYVDKKLNTTSDEDLISKLQDLQEMSNEKFAGFMSDATNEDLGIKNVTPLEVAKQVNAKKSIASTLFNKNAKINVLLSEAPQDDKDPAWTYRLIKQKLTPINNTANVAKMKAAVFAKQGLRTAFPEAKILSEEEKSQEINEYLDNIANNISDVKGGKEKALASKMSINSLVNDLINPKFEAKAREVLNAYTQDIKNGKDVAKSRKAAVEFLSKAHIANDADTLVREFVKDAGDPAREGSSKRQDYMVKAMEVSQYATVLYDLIDASGDGLEAALKEKFDDYKIKGANNTEIPLDSEEGIIAVADVLANVNMNSSAFQTFVAYTGLGSKAVDAIGKSINLSQFDTAVNQYSDHLKIASSVVRKIDNAFNEFAENSVNTTYRSYKDAASKFIKKLDAEFSEGSTELEKEILNKYKQSLNLVQTPVTDGKSIIDTLSDYHVQSRLSASDIVESGIAKLESYKGKISKRQSAMDCIILPKNSDKLQAKTEFVEQADKLTNKINSMISNLESDIKFEDKKQKTNV